MSATSDDPRGLLTLSMIVKDEGRTLARTLESVRPILDAWTIVDTGSTDDTRDVVRRALAGLPGDLHEAPFVDFATTRNLALDRAGDRAAFVLWLDADDELSGGPALRRFLERERDQEGDDRDAYLVRVEAGETFWSTRIVRSGAGYRWKGVVHEVLTHEGRPPPSRRVPGAVIKHRPGEGGAARTGERRARDIALLGEALRRDPGDARAAFYLAMTHLWLGQHDAAVEAFQQRIALGGWPEEVYQAKMGLAEAAEKRGDRWCEVLALYLDAHAFAPHRAEPLYRVALRYNATGEHALCLLFARRGLEIPFPERDIHFVDADVYRWKLADLVGSSAYWVSAFEIGEQAARAALRHRPGDPRLQQNLAFYEDRRRG